MDNCIAIAGADVPSMDCDFTIIFDNEPRNREIVKHIKKTIEQGYRVVLWPESIKEKDINDMILSGMSKENIKTIIKENAFVGIEAKLKFIEWKKINEGSVGRSIQKGNSTLEL